jgi:hypothetical protein
MVFNATFNNILVISWQSVSLVRKPEKTIEVFRFRFIVFYVTFNNILVIL